MAGPVGKSELGSILMQAKFAAASNLAQRDRLLQLQLQLQAGGGGGDGDAAPAVLRALFDVSVVGIERGACHLHTCLMIAAKNGIAPSLPLSFAVISDERLYDELVMLRLPAAPATQAQALARCEAALYALKLSQEHHLPRCIELLSKISDAAGKPPQSQEDIGRMERARTYLTRALVLANLAVTHTDLAVATISSYLDPQDVASLDRVIASRRDFT